MVDNLKQDISDLNAEKNTLMTEAKYQKTQLDQMQFNNAQLTGKLAVAKGHQDKMAINMQLTNAKLVKTLADLESTQVIRKKCEMELGQNTTLLKLRDSECNKFLKENQQLIKYREQLQKKMMSLERTKCDLTQEVLKMK